MNLEAFLETRARGKASQAVRVIIGLQAKAAKRIYDFAHFCGTA